MSTKHGVPKPDLFRGAIVRDCVVKNVVDGKTLKVLLNPLGWCPRPHGGWAARPTSTGPAHQAADPEEVRASIPRDPRRPGRPASDLRLPSLRLAPRLSSSSTP